MFTVLIYFHSIMTQTGAWKIAKYFKFYHHTTCFGKCGEESDVMYIVNDL